jgi:hypothetical protein
MKQDDIPQVRHTGDKTPDPVSSEQAQKGQVRDSDKPVLERPDPDTETVDKVITPTSIKEKEDEAREIEERLAENERLRKR